MNPIESIVSRFTDAVTETVEKFCDYIEQNEMGNAIELKELWVSFISGATGSSPTTQKNKKRRVDPESKPETKKDEPKYTIDTLRASKISDLKKICETYGLTKGGVKLTLITRICEKLGIDDSVDSPQTLDEPAPKKCKPTKVDESKETALVIDSAPSKLDLESLRAPPVIIEQNEYGHWIHRETSIVFTAEEEYVDGKKVKIALGFEDVDGNVEDLNEEKIQQCLKYNFQYRNPDNIIV